MTAPSAQFQPTSVGVDSNAVVVVPGSERSASKENARRDSIRATTQLQGRCGGRGRASAGCLPERRAMVAIMEKGMHFGGPDNRKTCVRFL